MIRTTLRLGAATAATMLGIAGAVHLGAAAGPTAGARAPLPVDSTILNTYKWRSVGPLRGGRSIAVAGVKGQPKVGYFGATGGGLWKTTDGGENWAPVTDGQITSASVGAVAVPETEPNTVYIGMGESAIRGDIMPGDGVYKSTDAGKTWKHIGFEGSDAISKIRVDPTNANIVYVADFGKYSVPSEQRGVFKSTDGGATWRKVLYRNPETGAIDISIDPHNPNVIYAALWQAYRKEYQMSSGGPGSGLFKSTDGGEHWTEITHNQGLPPGIDGRIGVSVSGADSNRVFALVENANGGLYRSDDRGATWALVNNENQIRQRAFYFTNVEADPHNKDLVYVMNVGALRSTDGGKTMTSFAGGDSHDLWIDPDNSDHVLHASDGGGAVSFNALSANRTWSARDYPTAQLYHVAATAKYPYDLCGAQQDSGTICVPSQVPQRFGRRGGGGAAANPLDGTYSPGGAEPGYVAPDPLDPDIFYSGGNNGSFLERLNRRTGEVREVGPYPRMFSGEESAILKERWQWTYPIIFSPVNPHVLYTSSQHLWKTTNGGQTWDRISPDLTRHDPKTMGVSGGPITHDMNGPEVYAVIFTIGPSKRTTNVIWTGSDDGLINVTKDGGKTWTNVTPKGMPDFGRVSMIDASNFDSASAYAAVKRPLLDDRAPYIYRTHDFGKTWTKIVNGIRADDYVHSVREDPTRKGLLYAATQHGVYISYDDGDQWQSLSLNLPDVPVHDIIVKGSDLAIATHGRSFYVLDNINPLRQYTPSMVASANPVLFKPAVAVRSTGPAPIQYWLKSPAEKIRLEILDSRGQLVRSFADSANADTTNRANAGGRRFRGFTTPLSRKVGVNTFQWDQHYANAVTFPGMILWGASTQGPDAPPGTYTVRLTADGKTVSQPLTVVRNPLHDATDADLQKQFALAIQIRDKVNEANNAVIEIRDLKSQVADRLSKSPDAALAGAGSKLTADLSAVEGEIYQVKNQAGEDPLNFPIKVNNRLASLLGVVTSADGAPIGSAPGIFTDLKAELKVQTDRLAHVLATDLPAFNAQATKLGLAVVKPKTPEVVF